MLARMDRSYWLSTHNEKKSIRIAIYGYAERPDFGNPGGKAYIPCGSVGKWKSARKVAWGDKIGFPPGAASGQSSLEQRRARTAQHDPSECDRRKNKRGV